MKLRQMNPFWKVLTLLYGALAIGFVMAIGQLFKAPLEITTLSQPVSTAPAQISPSKPSLASYHLFGVSAQEVREMVQAPWTLKGIVVHANGQATVIIESNQKEKILKIGDQIDKSTAIENIEKGKVIIRQGDELKSLSIFKKS